MLKPLIEKLSSALGLTTEELKRAAIFPLTLLAMVIIGDLIWGAVGLPDVKETIVIIKRLFTSHGYPLVGAAAFIETLLLIGLYVPGSVALILAASLAGQGVLNIWVVILLITLGCWTATLVNYGLGRYGWYRLLVRFGLQTAIEKMRVRAEIKGIKLIHLTYFNPNLAALSATSLGIMRVRFYRFAVHSLMAFLYWNTLWGFSFYFLGNWVEKHINYPNLITFILVVITIRIGYIMVKKKYIK